jgi:hypothetical protein
MTELTKTEREQHLKVTEISKTLADDVGITMEDVTVGRLSVQQPLSQLVQTGATKPGDIVNLLNEEVVGNKEKAVDFVIINSFKYWIEKEGDTFISRTPATNPNEKPWEEGSITRTYHHSFYALLVEDMKEGFAMPVEISFRSTDLASARKISTYILKLIMAKKPHWSKIFSMNTVLKQKEKYSWYGSNITLGRDATKEEMEMTANWHEILKSKQTKVSHIEDEGDSVEKRLNEGEGNGAVSYSAGRF